MIAELDQLAKIRHAVESSLAAGFKEVKILKVLVDRDVDFDGDQVLNIAVIFEGKPREINARTISGAVRHVRPHLEKLGEKAFPLLSFVSRRDAGTMAIGSL